MRLALLLLFGIVFSDSLMAQIEPPKLLCMRDDSLFWELPTNSCGPFVAYEIYFSNSGPQGPYSLLTTLTDPNATSFFHNNQINEERHYYMLSVFDCPGLSALSSDTINNQLPIALPILGASVNGFFPGSPQTGVTLTWMPSPSPETIGYIIYQNTPQGTIPVDTVYNTETWVNEETDAELSRQTFYVLALDACGNVSLFGTPHTTMLLDYSVSICDQSVNLIWSPYDGWLDGVGSYEILVSENADSAVVAAVVPGNQTEFRLPGLTDQIEYRIVVRAVKADGGAIAYSATKTFSTEIVQPIRQLEVFQVTIAPNGDPELAWRWNTNAELTSTIIWGYEGSQNVAVAIADFPVTTPLQPDPKFSFNWSSADQRSFFFIETTDNCDTVEQSSVVSPIRLSVSNINTLNNLLVWDPLLLPGAEFDEYQIFRISSSGNSIQFVDAVDASVLSYTDEIEPTTQSAGSTCYIVAAKGVYRFQENQDQIPFLSESNRSCATKDVLIYVPNAFAPNGRNPEFRPVPVFGASISDYQLSVFNRWGTEVFLTSDLNTGWDGTYRGQDQPSGVYAYRLTFSRSSGEVVERKGTVFLLR